MSSSSSEGSIVAWRPLPALTPRLGAALAASLALHAYGIALLDAVPRGMSWGELAKIEAGGRSTKLSVGLRPLATEWIPPVAPAMPPPAAAESPGPAMNQPGPVATPAPLFAPLPAHHYFRTPELDVQPGILVHVEPEYPESAARRFLSGRVVAQLMIDETGAVERVVIVSAEPPGYFEAPATKAFKAARFSPGMKGGRAVRVQMLLEINFDSPLPPKPTSVAS